MSILKKIMAISAGKFPARNLRLVFNDWKCLPGRFWCHFPLDTPSLSFSSDFQQRGMTCLKLFSHFQLLEIACQKMLFSHRLREIVCLNFMCHFHRQEVFRRKFFLTFTIHFLLQPPFPNLSLAVQIPFHYW